MKKKLLYLSLGSNRGERIDFLNRGMESVFRQIGIITKTSPVYQTDPWGFMDNSPFLNVVAEVETTLDPAQVLAVILGIERSMGRDRKSSENLGKGEKIYRSRTIDIDILFYNDLAMDSPGLVIPHPLIPLRRFVLVPMDAICPGLVHPVLRKTVRQLLLECPDHSGVIEYPQG